MKIHPCCQHNSVCTIEPKFELFQTCSAIVFWHCKANIRLFPAARPSGLVMASRPVPSFLNVSGHREKNTPPLTGPSHTVTITVLSLHASFEYKSTAAGKRSCNGIQNLHITRPWSRSAHASLLCFSASTDFHCNLSNALCLVFFTHISPSLCRFPLIKLYRLLLTTLSEFFCKMKILGYNKTKLQNHVGP